MNPLSALAWLLLAALAVWAHHAFWSRHYRVPTGEDELLFAQTADGWRLALARRRPRGPPRGPPVLLVHGLAANRVAMDFCLVRWSLSAHLAGAGFDCFALDLRGHGRSRPRPRGASSGWSVDDYVRLDVPAALEAIRLATGERRVLWVGHSQGALVGIAVCGLQPERIAGLVAIAAPVFFPARGPGRFLARLAFLFLGPMNRFVARSLAPFAGWWHPPVSEIAINTRNVERTLYRRVLVNVVENAPRGVLRQFARWALRDEFRSRDGATDYRAAMARCRQPALFVAGEADRIAPPEVVERAARLWGGEATLLRVGLAARARCDYGHADLLFGTAAPEDVFTPIRGWLTSHSTEGPSGAPGAVPEGGAA